MAGSPRVPDGSEPSPRRPVTDVPARLVVGDTARAFYGEVLAARVLMLLPGGMVLDDRAVALDSMSGAPWDTYALHDERVTELGADAAVVTYRVEAARDGQPYEALVSSTYVTEDGAWRLAIHQQTPVR